MHGNHSKFISLEQRQSAGDELYRERASDRFGRLIHVRHDRGVGPQQRHGLSEMISGTQCWSTGRRKQAVAPTGPRIRGF